MGRFYVIAGHCQISLKKGFSNRCCFNFLFTYLMIKFINKHKIEYDRIWEKKNPGYVILLWCNSDLKNVFEVETFPVSSSQCWGHTSSSINIYSW